MTAKRSRCVLASGNQGKLKELGGALEPHGITLIAQSEFDVSEADEIAVTFIENALIKARHASEATGLAAMADDSGLVVPALQGAPGIHSARYAQQTDSNKKPTDLDNINKLLHTLKSIDNRAAYFTCVLVYLRHASDPEPIIATGHWHGTITEQVTGEGGFGYDPVFYCPATELTAAAMGKERKQKISHRAKALASLKTQLDRR